MTTVTRDATGAVWETKTKTRGKVEVRIRYCCCCSLRVAAILIGIYTIIMYLIFLSLASVSLSRIVNGQPDPAPVYTPVATLKPNENSVIVIDPYFGTLGLYTEELKFGVGIRYPVLIINIVVFILLIIAAILVFVALCSEMPYLLLPWIGMMCWDILRGTISVILIFVYSGGDIRKIAVGIFFLGLQLFHMSLVLIMIAFFQYMIAKNRGQEFPADQPDKRSMNIEGSNIYPTMPTHYGYANSTYNASPHIKRDGTYPGYGGQTRDGPSTSRLQTISDSPNRYGPNAYQYREYSRQGYGRTA